jgi:hypothetical protein
MNRMQYKIAKVQASMAESSAYYFMEKANNADRVVVQMGHTVVVAYAVKDDTIIASAHVNDLINSTEYNKRAMTPETREMIRKAINDKKELVKSHM